MQIALRLLLGFFLVLGVALFVVLRVFLEEVKPGTRQAMEDSLVDAAYAFAALAQPEVVAGTIDSGAFAQAMQRYRQTSLDANIWGFKKNALEYRITIVNTKGVVIFDSSGQDLGKDYARWNDVLRTLRGQYGARSTLADPADENSSVMHVAAPIYNGKNIIGALTVSKPTQTLMPYIERSQSRIMRWSWGLLGLSLLAGLLFSWWIARSVSRLQTYAQAVASGQRATMPVIGRWSGNTELGELARAVENMRLKLEDKAYVENYVHTLTHELKSPLAAIAGAAELLHEDLPPAEHHRFVDNIQTQSERLRVLIDKLLALADVEQRQTPLQKTELDLYALSQTLVQQLEPRWRPKGLVFQIHVETGHATQVRAERFLLCQALTNLLENAIDFAPESSKVLISIAQSRSAAPNAKASPQGYIDWCIRDHGPGIADYALPRIFERFYSLPRPQWSNKNVQNNSPNNPPNNPQKSSGLGLCLVKEVAELHAGSIRVRNVAAAEGGGCLAVLSLPKT